MIEKAKAALSRPDLSLDEAVHLAQAYAQIAIAEALTELAALKKRETHRGSLVNVRRTGGRE